MVRTIFCNLIGKQIPIFDVSWKKKIFVEKQLNNGYRVT